MKGSAVAVSSRAAAPGTRGAATSGVQDGLWFLYRLIPGSPAFQTCRAYRVTGPLDIDALRAAWRAVLRRHESLRATFGEVGGRPFRGVTTDRPDSFTALDLRGHATTPSRVDRCVAERATEVIDLATGPLARLTVLRAGPLDHRIVIAAHEAAADPRSVSIIIEDLGDEYASFVTGWVGTGGRHASAAPVAREPRAPTGRVSWLIAADPAPRAGAPEPLPPPAPLELPTDRARETGPAAAGGLARFDWPGDAGEHRDLGRRLAETAAAIQTEPEVVLLTAFGVLLHRYAEQDRVTVGVPVSLRDAGSERAVGALSNLIVVCADLNGAPTFRDLVARVSASVRAATRHRRVPFPERVRAVNVDRDARRIPWCDAMFVVEEPESTLDLPGALVERVPVHHGGARTDLTLTIERTGPDVAGSLEFRASLFDLPSATRILEQLRTLLDAALDKPDLTVDSLPLESPERVRLAVRAADRITAGPSPSEPVHAVVRRHARTHPDAVAVRWAEQTVAYADLWRRATTMAEALSGLETPNGGRGVVGAAVAVRMSPGPGQIAALLGVLEAGAHLVWLGTGDAGDRGRSVLEHLRPVCLVLDAEPDGDPLAEWYRDELSGPVLFGDALAGADGAGPASGSGPADPYRLGELPARAYVAYTSGSTGRPKGIGQSHAALAQFVTWMAGQFGFGPGSRVAQWVAPEHDPALCEVFATLVGGGTLCPVPQRIRRNPEKLVDWLAGERITALQTVPSFARELLRVVRDRAAGLPALNCLLLMGEALPGDLVNGLRTALPGARLANLYGPTETIAATWHEIVADVSGTVPIGAPMPGRHVLVLDERDQPCPAGVTGEIVIRSPYVTPGYLGAVGGDTAFRAPAGLAEFAWSEFAGSQSSGSESSGAGSAAGEVARTYRTGDLGRWRFDGGLEFRGRKDFQVKLLGNRLELSDIEAVLAEHETVAECAVVALTDPDGLATHLVAYVVPRPGPGGQAASHTAWRAHLRQRFGRSMLPVSFRTLPDRLPRNVAGKVDRRRLPDPRSVTNAPARMPQSVTELGVASIWSRMLGVDGVAADAAFFAAGGDSLLALQLLSHVRDRFGVDVSPWAFLTNPTPAGLAATIDAAAASRTATSPQGTTKPRWGEGSDSGRDRAVG